MNDFQKQKQQSLDDHKLPIMESFDTIQGEGTYTGHAAFFIRLAGCDVGCLWCDVKESWQIQQNQWLSYDSIYELVNKSVAEIVVVTGGEPLLFELSELTSILKKNNKRTHIETSGAHPMSGIWDWICLSPKKFKAPVDDVYEQANELKIIVFNKSDFKWAEDHAKKVNENCQLFLQPEWSKRAEMMPLITAYILENPQWKFSLQSHKYMGIP